MKNLREISTRLEIAKKNIKKKQTENKGSNATSIGKALKISTELVAAVVVGATMGFLLDNWFDTKPWLTICLLYTSDAADEGNVIKSAKKMHRILKK